MVLLFQIKGCCLLFPIPFPPLPSEKISFRVVEIKQKWYIHAFVLYWTFVLQEAVVSSDDTGRDIEHCVRLQKKMKGFDQDLAVEAARVETINKLAEKLISQAHAGSADITQRQKALNERWNRLQDRASERRQRLAEACEMHAFDRDCNEVSEMINEKVRTPGQDHKQNRSDEDSFIIVSLQ